MKVRIVNLLGGKPEYIVLDAANVVIESDHGEPIAAAHTLGGGLSVIDFRDANFKAMLRNLGLDVDFTVDWIKPQPVPPNYTPLRVGS